MYEEQGNMVSDQEIAKGVETVLRRSDPNAVTTLNGVVHQLETQLGLDLSHKAGFIRDQITLLLRSHPQPQNDHFTLQNHPQFPPNFHLQVQQPPPPVSPVPQAQRQPSFSKVELVAQNDVGQVAVSENASAFAPKESVLAGTKRRGGGGGLNKVCGVSPELQAIVGEPALPRTEIVKQLWAYIRKHNLQDPSNKRKIICDDALRLLFETDCTDMFKMNKLLAKHIIRLEPSKVPGQPKRQKVDVVDSTTESGEPGESPMLISEALAKFLGVGQREMPQSEALKSVWDYIKNNHLEDPLNSMVILCDANLLELLGCESISALGVSEMLSRHHLFKQS